MNLFDPHKVFADYFEENVRPFAWALSKKLEEGNVCIDLNTFFEEKDGNPYLTDSSTAITIKDLIKSEKVTKDTEQIQPLVYYNDYLYLHRYFQYESDIFNAISSLIKYEKSSFSERYKYLKENSKYINDLFFDANPDKKTIINWQFVAVIESFLNNFSIITGGPGTGKTTTIAKVLALMYKVYPDLKVVLAAPTGKAAMRMKEALVNAKQKLPNVPKEIIEKFDAIEPYTIHRLLGYVKDSIYFKHNKENPLKYDLIIIDESSMVDTALMAKLLNAVDVEKRLILLGDKDQLASVEAGSIYGDLCHTQDDIMNQSSKEKFDCINDIIADKNQQITKDFLTTGKLNNLSEHVIELKQSYRFKSDKGIGLFSQSVLQGKMPVLNKEFNIYSTEEGVEINEKYSENNFNEIASIYEEYINEPDVKIALAKFNKVRILCAVREGECGVYEYNRKVESYLQKKKLIDLKDEFYINRPIMVLHNDYSLNLFNGDIGIIRKNDEGKIMACFLNGDGKIVEVLPGFISDIETTFAMTVHKGQGSEYDNILVVLPSYKTNRTLCRELLYTAVTRAKKYVCLFSTDEVLKNTIERRVSRMSGMAKRFA